MSSHVPPPYGQPGQPQPEFLGSGPGDVAPRRGRRNLLIGGGIAGAVAVIGGGAWAASWYLGSGPSTAEMLPANTVAFAQVNLDPSGDQKIAALNTLNKFPAFKDTVGVDSRDDLRQKVWEEIQQDGSCSGVDYQADIKPWLGDRMSVAAVDQGGDEPVGVVVVQVTDEDKARDGLDALLACDTDGDTDTGDQPGYVLEDGWAVIAETQAEAQRAVDDTDDAALADDSDFKDLIGEAGSDGVVTAYVAPDAGDVLGDLMDGARSGALGAGSSASTDALKDFGGLALQVRFDDAGLEVEYAGPDTQGADDVLSDDGAQAVTELPEGTAVAIGAGLQAGWADQALDTLSTSLGTSRADLVSQVEQATGLTVPADAETLLGSSFALAVSGDLDVDQIANSADASAIPVGLRVDGDADQVEGLLETLRSSTGQSDLFRSTSEGDAVAIGPNADWNEELARAGSLSGGTLGDSSRFEDVVPKADQASAIGYLDLNVNDGWLTRALESSGVGDAELVDNLEPLQALGFAGWVEGDMLHGQLRVTTD